MANKNYNFPLSEGILSIMNETINTNPRDYSKCGWSDNETIEVHTHHFGGCYVELALVTTPEKVVCVATLLDNNDKIIEDLEFDSIPEEVVFEIYDGELDEVRVKIG